MKFYVPRHLALLNAFIVSLGYVVVFLLTVSVFLPGAYPVVNMILALVISSGVVFLGSFFLFRYTLDRFIYSKIRLIYKSIHSVKAGKTERVRFKPGNNMIENVQQEVEHWEIVQQEEIDRLKQLEQYRRDFIGNVSHELKTPLFNVQGYVETLLDGGLEDPMINREYLRRTEKSVERLIRIVEDLDEIAQLESGQISLNIARFDIVALTREVADMLEMKARKNEVQICMPDLQRPVMVEGDREKIRQVLTNIIDNSIRYRSETDPRTKISFFDMDENILTEITDNGIGVEQEELPRLFERFYRTGRGRAKSKKGKGLGLAIAKHIIEAHHQSIHVRSTVGVGTTFGFTLRKTG
jgi:two-component system phosphate regulon sensor histidine kinase PhoR